jgi:hypothetical protein
MTGISIFLPTLLQGRLHIFHTNHYEIHVWCRPNQYCIQISVSLSVLPSYWLFQLTWWELLQKLHQPLLQIACSSAFHSSLAAHVWLLSALRPYA